MVESRTACNGLEESNDTSIQNVLEMHLKTRSIDNSFVTAERTTEFGGLTTMTRSKLSENTVVSQGNDSNLITYNSIVTDSISYEEHYLSLKSFFAACNGAYRSELLQLLFPIFSVFVVEQVDMEHHTSAQTFFQKYIGDHDERYKRDIGDLMQLLKSSDEQLQCRIVEMEKKTFNVVLTSKTLNYLMQHLRNSNNSVLLQTINKHLNIRILDESKYDLDQYWVTESPSEMDEEEDNEVSLLRESIRKLDTLSKTKPSIILHSFVNAYQG